MTDNTIGSDKNLPVDAMLDSRVQQLTEMGFDAATAKRALNRCNNDWDSALTMLTSGLVPDEDEFDLLQLDKNAATPPAPKPKEFEGNNDEDHFRAGVAKDAPDSAIIDSRVQQLIEMGFNGEDAEKALQVSNNDFNRAVELLASPVDDLSA
mmetsp:Transcript_26640/g.31430  ORF Transcript_26640/g.31430 Transcript_26640/m.31430 type:complete len:152 (-) Transcript_26640:197-652(-)|eukprot:CAMPEP_0114341672 /NCGR_PEP_ID=MMETSP0101-20121206/9204_1 /TAXON_ID=38822 ORGANISM="Pteridomonas danica, Strain PT" /NCGR_SAMPLE_ID=MMETSP0101 /ASSEMBLY_ACC=CAM_ASM_000211 /LENGTH=151 /DNA_ID=CAMNT_0001475355 /DNA_START=60 /DNA_END=515 /DNA_ORIENTATION=+